MNAVGYIRVSSEMQIETGHSLDAQRTLITEFARAKGWSLTEIFCDPGLSGTLTERPALKNLMARAERHEFDVVIVHAIDRFYRDLSGLLTALHHLDQHQVTFVSITENLDFSTPWGKLVLAVLGALAEIYIDKLRDETKKGKQARARKGLWNGSIPFGYCNGLCAACTDVNGKDYCPHFGQANRGDGKSLMAHPIESIAVQSAFAWYATGQFSDGRIAEKLNAFELAFPDGTVHRFRTKRFPKRGGPQPFSRDGVREILNRVFYTGQLPYRGTNSQGKKLRRHQVTFWAEGNHPILVDRDRFAHCQQVRHLLAKRPRTRRAKRIRHYPLSGTLRCAVCGRRMIGTARGEERRYFCSTPVQHCGTCPQPSINATAVENEIVQWLAAIHWPADWREQLLITFHPDQEEAQVREQVEAIQKRIKRTRELFLCGEIKHQEYLGEQEKNRDLLSRLQSQEGRDLIKKLEPLAEFANQWHQAEESGHLIEQKRLLHLAMTSCLLRGDTLVEIECSRELSRLLAWLYKDKLIKEDTGAEAYQTNLGASVATIKLTQ